MDDTWITRYYEQNTEKLLKNKRVFVLEGARRTGKTELINRLLKNFEGKVFIGTGDDMGLHEIFQSQKLQTLKTNFGNYDLVFLDEAHRIPNIGLNLKMMVDHLPDLFIIATGSSSLKLEDEVGEPLTGRQTERVLYPISVLELASQYGGMEVHQRLDDLMVYGTYPDVLNENARDDKIEYLQSLRSSYLLKDILELENVKYPAKLLSLLQLLAYQIGHEVSLNELANNLQIAKQSVERYLNLLERAYVIKKVGGFSKNLRSEVVKTARYYFLDNGVRNVVINNFNLVEMRNDMGQLWENFLFVERLKTREYKRRFATSYFWRTYDGKEVDLVEEKDGQLKGFEFKYGKAKSKGIKKWQETYPESTLEEIRRENYLEFLL